MGERCDSCQLETTQAYPHADALDCAIALRAKLAKLEAERDAMARVIYAVRALRADDNRPKGLALYEALREHDFELEKLRSQGEET